MQNSTQFEQGLRAVIALRPQHISVYALQVEEGTPFYRSGVQTDEDVMRQEWEQAHICLTQNGFVHYEISNFALLQHESRHNLNYWKNGTYLGLGSAAASYQNGERRSNVRAVCEYIQRVQNGQDAADFRERLEGAERAGERILLGLRCLDGVKLTEQDLSFFGAEIKRLAARGLVEQEGNLLKLTYEGMFLANQVFMSFVAPFENI